MHFYMTKPGVGVVRDIPDVHLTIDDQGLLLLDCVSLAETSATRTRITRDRNRGELTCCPAPSGQGWYAKAIRAEKKQKAINEALFPTTRPTLNSTRRPSQFQSEPSGCHGQANLRSRGVSA